MVPLLPFLALGGAWLLDVGATRLSNRLGKSCLFENALATLGTLAVLVLPVTASIAFDQAVSQTDLRQVAGRWIEENVAPGSKIAVEHYSIPFDRSRFLVDDVIRISDHDLAWYQQEGFDILVISDGVWDLLRRQSERYASKLGVYDQLVKTSALLAEFVPHPPRLVVAGYPTVAIYHFAPARIYKVAR
jgi:hypothetical protein